VSTEYEALNGSEQWHVNDSFTKIRYEQMSRFAPNTNPLILDIGSGSGQGGEVMRRLFPEAHITGLDAVSERNVISNSPYDRQIHSSTSVLPFGDCEFDFVVGGEILEHISPHDVNFFLEELFRVLKVSGILVLTTPNPNDWKLQFRRGTILGGSHISQHFPKATKLRLNLVGFKVKKVQGTGKTSRFLGARFPLNLYGSYLVVAQKR
jgi:2-polyprenyl-3-methyl-5-hydroxy-6-metoxy-1,4-benzoquinol methylase